MDKIKILLVPILATLMVAACGETPAPIVALAPTEKPTIDAPIPTAVPFDEIAQQELPPLPQADQLMGKTPAEVVAMAGTPNLVRRDRLAQHMLFETKTCVLDVVYYADDASAAFRASFVSARTKQNGETDADACLATLLPGGWLVQPQLDATPEAAQSEALVEPIVVSKPKEEGKP